MVINEQPISLGERIAVANVRNFESLIDKLRTETTGEKVSVESLLNAVGRRAYGPILLLLGVIATSPIAAVPGLNWVFALLTLVIAMQILIGKDFPWVPQRILAFEFKRETMVNGLTKMEPYAVRVDKFLKPRLTFLSDPPFVQMVALICIVAALVTFPLGLVPFGPLLPSLAILFFGLGLTARDGVMLVLSGLGLAGAVWLVVRIYTHVNGGG